MRKFTLGFVLMGLLWMSMPAQAGGWAVLTLDAWPNRVTANKPFTIGFTLRQHGQTLLGGQSGSVIFKKDKRQTLFKVYEAGATGHYTATITLPQAGAWQWRIAIFGEHEMPALTVVDPAGKAAQSNTPAALGKNLFTAKGCSSCHAHSDVSESGMFANAYGAEGAPDLSLPKYDAAYLLDWLKNPKAVKPNTIMPSLGLKPAEIDALVAFLRQRASP